MPKEDYLIKLLEKLSRVVAAMLGFRDKGLPEESIALADDTYRELFSLDTTELAAMPADDFVKLLRKENFTATYLEAVAELTHETAKSFAASGEDGMANLFYMKSLKAYYLLNEKDRTFSFEREAIISELENITTQP